MVGDAKCDESIVELTDRGRSEYRSLLKMSTNTPTSVHMWSFLLTFMECLWFFHNPESLHNITQVKQIKRSSEIPHLDLKLTVCQTLFRLRREGNNHIPNKLYSVQTTRCSPGFLLHVYQTLPRPGPKCRLRPFYGC